MRKKESITPSVTWTKSHKGFGMKELNTKTGRKESSAGFWARVHAVVR